MKLDRRVAANLALSSSGTWATDRFRYLGDKPASRVLPAGAALHLELVTTIPQFKSPAIGTDGYDPGGYPIAADRTSFSLTRQTVLPRLPGLLPADDRLFYGMVVLPNCSSRWSATT